MNIPQIFISEIRKLIPIQFLTAISSIEYSKLFKFEVSQVQDIRISLHDSTNSINFNFQ